VLEEMPPREIEIIKLKKKCEGETQPDAGMNPSVFSLAVLKHG